MLVVDERERQALRNSQTGGSRAIATYQGAQTAIPLAPGGSITGDGDGVIQSSARLTAAGRAPSLIPHSPTDPLGSYGQEIALWRTVRLRSTTWEVPLGRFRITGSENEVEHFRRGTREVKSWSIDLTLQDRFEQIDEDDFLTAEAPQAGATVWSEIRRLSPIPIQERLGDVSVPRTMVYESRIDAIAELMGLLGGVPHLTREGVLTARAADVWMLNPAPVFDIDGVIGWGDKRSNAFKNQVRTTNPSDSAIVGFAQHLDDTDPRSVSRAGGRTIVHSSPLYTTRAAANAGAKTRLRSVLSQRSRVITVVCSPEALLIELGDFGRVYDPKQDREAFGEVAGYSFPLDPTRPPTLDLIVAQEV